MNSTPRRNPASIAAARILLALFISSSHADVLLSPMDEWIGNNNTGRTGANLLDDAWRLDVLNAATALGQPPPAIQTADIFSGMTSGSLATVTNFTVGGMDYTVGATFGNMFSGTGENGSAPVSTSTSLSSFTAPLISAATINGATMQSNAPVPSDINTNTLTRVSTTYDIGTANNVNRTALKLSFDASPTPIYAFGLFLGDVESNSATPARILAYDLAGNLLEDFDLEYTGKVNGVANTYAWGTTPYSTTPGSLAPHGDTTTSFLGIISTGVPIGHVILVVGDESNSGASYSAGHAEGIGVGGFTIATFIVPEPSTALLALFALPLILSRRSRK